jgi:CHRD domain
MKIQKYGMLWTIFLALFSSNARAATIVYDVVLSGSQSVPTNVTTATGTATVTVDDVLDTVAVSLSFTGLTGGNASAAHIHCCVATDANGPVVRHYSIRL